MKTVNIKAYKFDELSKDVQSKVLDRERYINVEMADYWHDGVFEDFIEQAKPFYEIEKKDIRFSGFSSQGGGASFQGGVNVYEFIKAYGKDKYGFLNDCTKEEIEEIFYRPALGFDKYSRYCHSNTMIFELEINDDDLLIEKSKSITYEEAEKIINKLENDILEDAKKEADRLYRTLQKEYEFFTEDEQVRETILSNELEFLENGDSSPYYEE